MCVVYSLTFCQSFPEEKEPENCQFVSTSKMKCALEFISMVKGGGI